jgi:hypothetical protein
VARSGHRVPPVNGDQVRGTWFLRPSRTAGYDGPEVEDLLDRIAAELDAGRPAGPLIENATLRRGSERDRARARTGQCDIDAVDWFLGQLLAGGGDGERAKLDEDPWRGLRMVAQYTRTGVSNLAERPAETAWRVDRESFAKECQDAWRDFGQQPGLQLWWRPGGKARLWAMALGNHFELRTAEQQTLASVRGWDWKTRIVSVGGRSFTLQNTVATKSLFPGSSELAARMARDNEGHFAKKTEGRRIRLPGGTFPGRDRLIELLDEAGMPILCGSGMNHNGRAFARITSPDQRWLRFPVRGTRRANAIMTAVDQAGNRIARYRLADKGRNLEWKPTWNWPIPVEITVHPDWELTEELVLAIAISAPWLNEYCSVPRSH